MEWEYKSTDFTDTEWIEAIALYRWTNPLNKGHYCKQKGVYYFDSFIYNLIEVQIERRRTMGAEGKGKRFSV